jgi:hypothetical protein
MPEQGGFAAAAAPQDDQDLPLIHRKVHILENSPVAVSGRKVFHLDNGDLFSLQQNSTQD